MIETKQILCFCSYLPFFNPLNSQMPAPLPHPPPSTFQCTAEHIEKREGGGYCQLNGLIERWRLHLEIIILTRMKLQVSFRMKKSYNFIREDNTVAVVISGAHYQEHDYKVHPAISTVTKVSIFGSRFPKKSSYHDDCHKSEKYGVIKSHIVIGQIRHPLFVSRKKEI